MAEKRDQKISPKRRFLSALFGGRKGERPPVGNPTSIVTLELMEKTGIFFPQAHLDPRQMAELAAAGHGILGFDAVMPEFSVQQRPPPWDARWTGKSFHDADAKTHPSKS
jgi:[methyl-Co(III) methanol-specific corrinoid protein]:coenzyme M methyltransferase